MFNGSFTNLNLLNECLAAIRSVLGCRALDDLSTNLDVKLFWHFGYFWSVFLYWHIFKIKFFFPFKSRIVKRISGRQRVLRRLNLRPLCHTAGDTLTMAQVTRVTLSRAALSCVTLCHECHESCLRFWWGSQQFCLVTPPPVGKWKMDSSLGSGRKRRGHNVTTSFQESSTQSRQDAGGSLSSSNGRQRISLDRSRLTFPSHAGLSSRDDDEWEVALVWINYSLFTSWRLEMDVVCGDLGWKEDWGKQVKDCGDAGTVRHTRSAPSPGIK